MEMWPCGPPACAAAVPQIGWQGSSASTHAHARDLMESQHINSKADIWGPSCMSCALSVPRVDQLCKMCLLLQVQAELAEQQQAHQQVVGQSTDVLAQFNDLQARYCLQSSTLCQLCWSNALQASRTACAFATHHHRCTWVGLHQTNVCGKAVPMWSQSWQCKSATTLQAVQV